MGSSSASPVRFRDRETGEIRAEKIAGEKALRFLHVHPRGHAAIIPGRALGPAGLQELQEKVRRPPRELTAGRRCRRIPP